MHVEYFIRSLLEKRESLISKNEKEVVVDIILASLGVKMRIGHFKIQNREQIISQEISVIKYPFVHPKTRMEGSKGQGHIRSMLRALKLFQEILCLQRAGNVLQIIPYFY